MRRSFSWRRWFAVAVVATPLLAACPFESAEKHLARGNELAAKQDHAGAAIEFKNVLESEPNSAAVRFLLGRELLAQGQARTAEVELQKAFDAGFDRDAVVPLIVKSQVVQGQPERISKEMIRPELRTRRANAELQGWLGAAALSQGRLDDGLRAYRSAQLWDSEYLPAQLGEARVKAMQGDLDAAMLKVMAILAKDAAQVDGLLLKGDLSRAKGKTDEAIDAYSSAVKADPRNVMARLDLASAYIANNTVDLADEQVAQLKKIAPNYAGVSYVDAVIAFSRKDYLRASDAVARSLQENAANGPAQVLSGAISLAMGQPAQAEVHLLEGIRLARDAIYPRRLLTGLYLRQRQPDKAEEILRPALAILPDDSNLLGLAGEVAVQKGDFQNASKYLERASTIDPGNIAVRVRGAAVDLARGEMATGFAALEAAAKASDSNPSPDIALVIARLNHRQYDEALAAWNRLEKLQPDNPVTYNLRAAIDLGRDDRPAARQALEHAIQIQPNYFPAVANLAALDEAEGNFNAARQRYRKLLEKDPKNTSALIALAQFEANHGGKSDVVLPLLLEARKTNPTAEQPVVTLAAYYASQHNLKQALSTAQEGLAGAPKDLTYLNLIGDLQLQLGGVDQAIVAFRQLAAAKPQVVDYQIRLGQAMLRANQTDLAMPVFQNAVRAFPEAYGAQAAAITSLLRAQKTTEAARLLADVEKASPKSPVLTELEGDVKLATLHYSDAAAAYRKASSTTPSSELVMKLSMALRRGGDAKNAAAVLDDWLKAHPTDLAVRVFESDAALQAKDYAVAARGYRAALETRPDDPLLLNNLAWASWQLKDPQALSFAEKANAIAPESASVSDTLGWILVDQGETKKGIELLEKAVAAAPGRPEIALHLAKAQIKDGRKDAARKTLHALLESSPNSAEGIESKALISTL